MKRGKAVKLYALYQHGVLQQASRFAYQLVGTHPNGRLKKSFQESGYEVIRVLVSPLPFRKRARKVK